MGSLVWAAQTIWWNSLTEDERKPWIDKAIEELRIVIEKEKALGLDLDVMGPTDAKKRKR